MAESEIRAIDVRIATETFYKCLYAQYPKIVDRFRDVNAQKQMFEIALKTVLFRHDDDIELDKYLKILGDKHKMVGILPIHMQQGLEAFVEAVRAGNPMLSEQDVSRLTAIYQKLVQIMGYPDPDRSGLLNAPKEQDA